MKYLLKSILCLTLLIPGFYGFGNGYFEWTPALKQAYHQATSLRLEMAEQSLSRIAKEDPNNLIRFHVENYIDFFRVYINEDEKEFDQLEKNKDDRLDQIKDNGDENSPYYLYLQADIRLQWALARLKFEEYTTAFFETNKAFKLLTENAEKFPDFLPNKKDLGILHAMVSTIPDNYKWAIDWFSSMEGTLDQGRGELLEVIKYAKQHDFIYEREIYVYYAYLMLHLGNDGEQAWQIINTANLNPLDNPLDCFIMANVAMRTDRGDDAISILENKPVGKEYQPFLYLDYLLGLAKLQRLDKDASVYLSRFTEKFNGRNFIKDAYQKLAWASLLEGDVWEYRHFMDECKSKGYKVVGSDQSAYNEAVRGEVPNLILLKARLLFDGGHFEKAEALLINYNEDNFQSEEQHLEFSYRKGRVAQVLEKYKEALGFYEKTIEAGRNAPWYFACRAALEKGHIYEKLNDSNAAKKAFRLCLKISPDDHKSGLHQQAKAGLTRLEN